MAVVASALLTLKGENLRFEAFIPDNSSETAPQQCGLAIEVPFISCNRSSESRTRKDLMS